MNMNAASNLVKKTWLKLCVFGSLFMTNAVLASGDADDVFEPLNDKTDQIREQIVMWGTGLSVLCIVIFGILTMCNVMPKKWGILICAGCLIIVAGVNISSFLLSA
ncbi:hypothetical protein GNP80_08880 [Aliivibrio fischeri]|uniref:TrbC/VirB2 family protein n=1 Tax=Aliivibrio fischeri TaxID=668 RepID=UPI0012D8A95C|nr:TrbC/VirB2 family protein [Aliivibrio fischeri]MUK92555.1 hypothetical protein [Aliivibrio fischeri]